MHAYMCMILMYNISYTHLQQAYTRSFRCVYRNVPSPLSCTREIIISLVFQFSFLRKPSNIYVTCPIHPCVKPPRHWEIWTISCHYYPITYTSAFISPCDTSKLNTVAHYARRSGPGLGASVGLQHPRLPA